MTARTIGDFLAGYRDGASVPATVDEVLAGLDGAPAGVLIGPPLHELARAAARRLDDTDPAGLPLYGVPFVVKDNIDVDGAPTTAACPGFAYIAEQDAEVVRRVLAAGAIVVGKSNLDQFATGLVGTRSPYGTPPNALDACLAPGGSSSGSAVAVALGLVPFALGTDTAGSGRVPAALNGIVGLKPAVGGWSTHGIVPAVPRFDCPSVFAASVADASLVAATAGGRPHGTVPARRVIVGVPDPALTDLVEPVRRVFEEAVGRLRALGAELRPVDVRPLLELGAMLYGSALIADRAAAIGDALAGRPAALDPVVAAVIGRGADLTAMDAYRAEHDVARRRTSAWELLAGIDVLALPTTPNVPTLAAVRADPIGENDRTGRFTTFVNLLGSAAVALPVLAGVPTGLQLVGAAADDTALFDLARRLETGHSLPTGQAPDTTVVVVGAHLTGQPLNHQLTSRGGTFLACTTTSADYRLYALSATEPPKPGLVRVEPGRGAAIEVEVWSLTDDALGSLVRTVPAPLCIGTIVLADGSRHLGFLCEPAGLDGARDISAWGGWRGFLASLT